MSEPRDTPTTADVTERTAWASPRLERLGLATTAGGAQPSTIEFPSTDSYASFAPVS